MTQVVVVVLLAGGGTFMFLAALGIVRMPDLYMRLSACTKAATLGVTMTLIGCALYFDDVGVASRAIATILFVFLTAPVAGHMIGRAAYLANTPLWENTKIDELRGRYDLARDVLHSRSPSDPPDDGTDSHVIRPGAPPSGL